MKGTFTLFGKPIREIDLPDDYLETLPLRLSAFIEAALDLGCRVEVGGDIPVAFRKEGIEPGKENGTSDKAS